MNFDRNSLGMFWQKLLLDRKSAQISLWQNGIRYLFFCQTIEQFRIDHPISSVFLDGKDITTALADYKLEFNPHDGLWVTKPEVNIHSGYFICTGTYGNKQRTVLLLLRVLSGVPTLPIPRILESNPPQPLIGSNMTLTCRCGEWTLDSISRRS